jgi:hypothetical protein
MQPQSGVLFGVQLKDEIVWKPLLISSHLFVESLGRDAIQGGQVLVDQHLFSAQRARSCRGRISRACIHIDRDAPTVCRVDR